MLGSALKSFMKFFDRKFYPNAYPCFGGAASVYQHTDTDVSIDSARAIGTRARRTAPQAACQHGRLTGSGGAVRLLQIDGDVAQQALGQVQIIPRKFDGTNSLPNW